MKKILVLGVIAALLSCGLILASCDDGACCSKSDFDEIVKLQMEAEKLDSSDLQNIEKLLEIASKLLEASADLPKCCREVEEVKGSCCEDVAKELGLL